MKERAQRLLLSIGIVLVVAMHPCARMVRLALSGDESLFHRFPARSDV